MNQNPNPPVANQGQQGQVASAQAAPAQAAPAPMNSARLLNESSGRFDSLNTSLGENHPGSAGLVALKQHVQKRFEYLNKEVRYLHNQIQQLGDTENGKSQANFDAAMDNTLDHFSGSQTQFYQNVIDQAENLGLNPEELDELKEIVKQAQDDEKQHINHVQNASKDVMQKRYQEFLQLSIKGNSYQPKKDYWTEEGQAQPGDNIGVQFGQQPVTEYDRDLPEPTGKASLQEQLKLELKVPPVTVTSILQLLAGIKSQAPKVSVKVNKDGTTTLTFPKYGVSKLQVQRALQKIMMQRIAKGETEIDLSGVPKKYAAAAYVSARELGVPQDKIILSEGFKLKAKDIARGNERRAALKQHSGIQDELHFVQGPLLDMNGPEAVPLVVQQGVQQMQQEIPLGPQQDFEEDTLDAKDENLLKFDTVSQAKPKFSEDYKEGKKAEDELSAKLEGELDELLKINPDEVPKSEEKLEDDQLLDVKSDEIPKAEMKSEASEKDLGNAKTPKPSTSKVKADVEADDEESEKGVGIKTGVSGEGVEFEQRNSETTNNGDYKPSNQLLQLCSKAINAVDELEKRIEEEQRLEREGQTSGQGVKSAPSPSPNN